MTADQLSDSKPTRRRVIEWFLGGGLLASLASFIYPVLRYLVPPPVADLGGDEVVAAKLMELKPNSGKIFRFGNRPGLLIRTASGEYRARSRARSRRRRFLRRKKALLHTGDEHRIEFEPFGSVDGHERHGVGSVFEPSGLIEYWNFAAPP